MIHSPLQYPTTNKVYKPIKTRASSHTIVHCSRPVRTVEKILSVPGSNPISPNILPTQFFSNNTSHSLIKTAIHQHHTVQFGEHVSLAHTFNPNKENRKIMLETTLDLAVLISDSTDLVASVKDPTRSLPSPAPTQCPAAGLSHLYPPLHLPNATCSCLCLLGRLFACKHWMVV